MEHSEKTNFTGLLKKILVNNAVTILFVVICIAGIVLADQPMPYVVGEISSRLFRNLILILALLVPVWAGMGMNFSIVLSYGGTDRNYGFYEFFCNRGSRTRFGFYSQCSALTVFWKSDRTLI